MSDSYLPRRKEGPSGRDGDRFELQPASKAGDLGYVGYAGYNTNAPAGTSGKEQFVQVVDMLFRQKWFVLLGFIIVLGLSYYVTENTPPAFETASFVMVDLGRVQVNMGGRSPSGNSSGEGVFDIFARNDRTIPGEIRLLEISEELVQRVNFRMEENEELASESTTAAPGVPRPTGRVRFSPETSSNNIIRIISTSSDASHAALMANLYAEEYVRLTRDASRSQTLALRQSLEEKEREQRYELDRIEERIQQFRQSESIGLDQAASSLVGQIAAIEVQIEEGEVELEVEQAALRSMENELEDINPQLAQRIASGVERRIEALQGQLATEEDARDQFLLQNPELRTGATNALRELNQRIERLQAEIDSLSVQYVNEVDAAGGLVGSADGLAYVASLRRDIAQRRISISRIEARLGVLEGRLAGLQNAMQNLPAQSLELAQLERDRVRIEMVYQSTVAQLQEAYIDEESRQGYARLIRRAQVPVAPVSPDAVQNMILGGFFGLLVGLGLAVVRDKLDNRIYQSTQLRKMGLKEIGVIPNMSAIIKRDYDGNDFLEHNGQHFSTSLISFLNPVSPSSEAYRYLRTNIQFSVPGTGVQTLLITSPGMSEGKSTTAANLAIVMAQSGRSTLLIDGDLRRPKLHRLFGLPRDAGLTELLTEGAYVDPDSWSTYVDNLSVLTAGRFDNKQKTNGKPVPAINAIASRDSIISNPSELLGSAQMLEFLAEMRMRFEVIIIDTPPVLAATDAVLLSAQTDGTLIVARAGVTKEAELGLSVESLDDVGAAIIGIVLNGFDIKMAYGHRYKYKHYNKYGRFSEYEYY